MFILILILHLIIPQPAYAQVVPIPTVNLPIGNSPTQVPTDEPTTVQIATPTQITTSSPTIAPTIADTPIPTISVAPTAIVTSTPTVNPTITGSIIVTSTPITALGSTIAPTSSSTEVVTPQPTLTPIPIITNSTPPQIPPIIPSVIKGVSETFAPDVIFPKSFLQFEKDNGNVYASTQLNPSQTRGLLLVSLLLIIGGFGLILYTKASALFVNRQVIEYPNTEYALSEVSN